MRILVTAGGTREAIDDVRYVSNVSTGALGCAIAESFLAVREDCQMVYLCGEGAIVPTERLNLRVVRVGDVSSLTLTLREIFDEANVDGIIHAMAVSDYTIDRVTSSELLAKSVEDRLQSAESAQREEKRSLKDWIHAALHDGMAVTAGKISSDWEDLILVMRRTPKVIALLRALNSKAVLVGFKLLSGVSAEDLLDAGRGILRKNQCDFVFANDLREKTESGHNGYLIHQDGEVELLEGREQIAKRIALCVTQEIDKRKRVL
jgi:phosphopantothenate-cysteine ligase